ncbi:senescence associated gene 20-like [Dioscorea cayenensis subsp. rotundata]|uniref:Senescence associated gene 20-like n=1 Tax=Dioscorea cayennensis subsp. rotundata TaxID=55577 RepID=A0AB40BYD6_DIOCR|nr:senescence associated gene 20-like [Dioscorea cayenensis subsp. rotundata]
METSITANKNVVELLYTLITRGETEEATRLMASDLEWWFHGPPRRQHMMMLLTGQSGALTGFRFEPQRVAEVGEWVVAEGEEEGAYWVHVWTVKDGVITQFREYFNTWLTVREVGQVGPTKMDTLWQSEPRSYLGRSLPSLVLAV